MNVHEAVEKYTEDGFRVVRCKPKSKAPAGKGWKDGKAPVASQFAPHDNIGFLAGEQADGTYLVDLDLDKDSARTIAHHILADYGPACHGKLEVGQTYASHYWFRSKHEVKTRRYLNVGGACLLEVRGDGVQTIVEPSTHPNGSPVKWLRYVPFNDMPSDFETVHYELKAIAALSLLAENWPEEGSRQNLTMAVAGYLMHAGLLGTTVLNYTYSLLDAVGENTTERRTAVQNTVLAYQKGRNTTGGPTIESIIGQQVYDKFVDFLDIEVPTVELDDMEPESRVSTQLISAYDLLANKDFANDEVVEGLIWAGKTHWLYSDPNAGKTMLALAIAMHVAAGQDFAGRIVQQGPVVIIEEDSSLAVIAGYLDNFASVYDLSFSDLPVYFNEEQGIRIFKPRDSDRIIDLVDNCLSQPKLVIFDSCERILPSNTFNSREVDPLDRLLKTLANRGIANLVLDHTNKSQYENPNDMDVLYGSRAKSAIADIMVQLQGSIKSGALVGTFTKFRGDTPPPMDIYYRADDGFEIKDRPASTKTPYEGEILGWFIAQPRRWFDECYLEDVLLEHHDGKVLTEEDEMLYKRLQRTLHSLASRRILRRTKDLEGIESYKLNIW